MCKPIDLWVALVPACAPANHKDDEHFYNK